MTQYCGSYIPCLLAKPEQDTLISRVVGKYGGQSMKVGPVEFRSLLKDILEELSAEFEKDPIILPPLEVLTGADLRRVSDFSVSHLGSHVVLQPA